MLGIWICAILFLCNIVVAMPIDNRTACEEKFTVAESSEMFGETVNCEECDEDEQELLLILRELLEIEKASQGSRYSMQQPSQDGDIPSGLKDRGAAARYQDSQQGVVVENLSENRNTAVTILVFIIVLVIAGISAFFVHLCRGHLLISSEVLEKAKKYAEIPWEVKFQQAQESYMKDPRRFVGKFGPYLHDLLHNVHPNTEYPDVNNSEISAKSTESKNDDQKLIIRDCNNAERETRLPIEKGEDSSETCPDSEHSSTESKEDEQGLNIVDDSHRISARRVIPPIGKESVMNTQRLIIGNKGRDYIMKRYGVLNKASRYKMLLLCGKKAKAEGNRRFGGHLKKSAETFTGTSWNIGKVGYKALCRLVVDRIPEDDWMEFVRMDLNLEETEIQCFRGKYCIFNKEQKRQILEGF